MLHKKSPLPQVSVVVPLYNSSKFIEGTLSSLTSQSFSEWEAILVNDGSTDNTAERVTPFLKDARFRYLEQENQGIAGARNTAIKAAQGEWVCLLDHDDRWLPQKLEKQLAFTRLHNCDITSTDAFVVKGDTRNLYSEGYGKELIDLLQRSLDDPQVDVCRLLFRGDWLCAPSVMIRRTLFDRYGLLDTFAAPADDYEMWLRCMPEAKIGYLHKPLIEYHIHESNYSHDFVRTTRKVIYVLNKTKKRFVADEPRLAEIQQAINVQHHHLFAALMRSRSYLAVLRHIADLCSTGRNGFGIYRTSRRYGWR